MPRILIAVAALAVVSAAPAPRTPDARAVLDAAKAATGGAAWDRLDGSYESGKHGDTEYRTWLDFRHYGMRSEGGPANAARVHAFDGNVSWDQRPDGAVKINQDPAALVEAITTAFSSNNGFFFPRRFPGTVRYLRTGTIDTRSFDVIEVKPEGGRAFELWFDRKTHLMGRIDDLHGTPAVTVDISDYRKVGPVLIGFHGVVRIPDGTVVEELNVGTVVLTKVDRSRFSPPAKP